MCTLPSRALPAAEKATSEETSAESSPIALTQAQDKSVDLQSGLLTHYNDVNGTSEMWSI